MKNDDAARPATVVNLPGWVAKLPADVRRVVEAAPSVRIPGSRADLVSWSLGGQGADRFEVNYDTPGHGNICEATVVKCRNGVVVNYPDTYLRRRDPESLVMGDTQLSDKPRFEDRFHRPFPDLRREVFTWLQGQDLILMPF